MAGPRLSVALLLFAALFSIAHASNVCHKPGFWCNGGSSMCGDHELWHCPRDCFCHINRCKPKEPKCKGDLRNYDCIDHKHFCLGGKKMMCAPGTFCGAHRGSGTPCYITKKPKRCHEHHWQCCDKRHYCLNGWKVKCLPGTRCHGWGPCVKHV